MRITISVDVEPGTEEGDKQLQLLADMLAGLGFVGHVGREGDKHFYALPLAHEEGDDQK